MCNQLIVEMGMCEEGEIQQLWKKEHGWWWFSRLWASSGLLYQHKERVVATTASKGLFVLRGPQKKTLNSSSSSYERERKTKICAIAEPSKNLAFWWKNWVQEFWIPMRRKKGENLVTQRWYANMNWAQ